MSEEDRIVNELLEKNGKIRLARKVYELENIIKEVREYIKENNFHCKNQVEQEQYDKELLKILDKVDKGE